MLVEGLVEKVRLKLRQFAASPVSEPLVCIDNLPYDHLHVENL